MCMYIYIQISGIFRIFEKAACFLRQFASAIVKQKCIWRIKCHAAFYAGKVLLLPLHIFQSLDLFYSYSLPLLPLLPTVAFVHLCTSLYIFVHLCTFWSAVTCRWSSKCFWASDEDHAIAVWGWSSRLESAEVKPHWKHHVFTCVHCVRTCVYGFVILKYVKQLKGITKVPQRHTQKHGSFSQNLHWLGGYISMYGRGQGMLFCFFASNLLRTQQKKATFCIASVELVVEITGMEIAFILLCSHCRDPQSWTDHAFCGEGMVFCLNGAGFTSVGQLHHECAWPWRNLRTTK